MLTETPPAPDVDGLRQLWAAVGAADRVQVAEQYLALPGHAARRAVVAAGTIGTPTSVQVSSTHGYHAVSMMRGFLGAQGDRVGNGPVTVSARTFTAPLVDPLARDGWTDLPGVPLVTFAEATVGADLVVHAGNGLAALELLGQAGDLAGTVLLDISNPLDFSAGFPPTLAVKDTDSLAEQLQRAHPDARVVKSLNTMNAHLMVEPRSLADGDHTVFVAGDVRARSIKRVASAVGEGSMAVSLVHQYLVDA